MTDPDFDWTEILSEPERSKVRADLTAQKGTFLESFPTREELEQSGREGREAFYRAKHTIHAKETERLLNAAAEHIAGTLAQPTDPRAWDQLLLYCPTEALECRLHRVKLRVVP